MFSEVFKNIYLPTFIYVCMHTYTDMPEENAGCPEAEVKNGLY